MMVRKEAIILDAKNSEQIVGNFPIISWSINAAISSNEFSIVKVATNSEHTEQLVKNSFPNVQVMQNSDFTVESFTQDSLVDIVAVIDASCILIKSQHLKDAISQLLQNHNKEYLTTTVDPNASIPSKLYNLLNEGFNFFITKTSAGIQNTENTLLFKLPSYVTINTNNTSWKTIDLISKDSEHYHPMHHLLPIFYPGKVKLFVTDVDGVLTDQCVILDEEKEFAKKFNMRDGHGISMLKQQGVVVRFLTTEQTKFSAVRARKLGIEMVAMVKGNKINTLNQWKEELQLEWNNIAYIGDDLPDLECVKTVGYSACPSDAEPELKNSAKFLCKRKGGEGCVREFISFLFDIKVV